MDRLRTIGLVRANQHNALSHLLYNIDRYALLCRHRQELSQMLAKPLKRGPFH